MRATYEYAIDRATSYHFGSDGLPVMSFGSVSIHEICLSLMLTNIKHPIVFVTLIMADILENAFCLWSLYRSRAKQRVVPVGDDETSTDIEITKQILTKRTSSVYSLAKDLKSKTGKQKDGTILFIAATLLQREMVEVVVPLQAMGVISILHVADVKSNSLTASWTDTSEYHQTLMYLGIDIVLEIVVFMVTIMILGAIFPKQLSTRRILLGLIRTNAVAMFLVMLLTWLSFLCFQCFFFGMDTTFRFEWVGCDDDVNSTSWIGGFDWDC